MAKDPTGAKQVARFVKAFPLKFPMGIGDLFEDRPRAVRGPEWLQHMLRLGYVTEGEDCDRCLWAMVNTILIAEAAGKGFAVYKNVMRRRGYGAGNEVLTKRRLRELLADEEAARAMVYNLQNVGRDVRSTPMQWSYEGKKLDCAVKYLSWRPPWLPRRSGRRRAWSRLGSITVIEPNSIRRLSALVRHCGRGDTMAAHKLEGSDLAERAGGVAFSEARG